MTNTAVRNFTPVDTTEIIRNRIEEKVERIQEKRAFARSRLFRCIRFLFNCETDNPYNLTPDMKVKLYLLIQTGNIGHTPFLSWHRTPWEAKRHQRTDWIRSSRFFAVFYGCPISSSVTWAVLFSTVPARHSRRVSSRAGVQYPDGFIRNGRTGSLLHRYPHR